MRNILDETESLCPQCLRCIPARRVAENGNVYLEKTCPEHGEFRALIWRGDGTDYLDWAQHSQKAEGPLKSLTGVDKGCPYDCGLCPEHKANTCTLVMEVTQECNLRCPICFASSGEALNYEPDLETIRGMYQTVLDAAGTPSVQLSGGEPTLRDDLPQIISLGRQMGFEHIMVNTNGIRIAKDKEYLEKLVNSGAGTIYLQFDGITDEVYRYTRGTSLFQLKIEAIRNCAEAKVGVILVPTLIPGINDQQIGDIVLFAKQWVPTVKGIHFQPISYFGRYPKAPEDEDRITIPDVIRALEEQTKGELKKEYFLPRRSEDSHCSFGSLFAAKEGQLLPITNQKFVREATWAGKYTKAPWEAARSFMKLRWRLREEQEGSSCCSCKTSPESKAASGNKLINWLRTHSLTITGMPFQDVWSIDLERLKRCCTHIVTPNMRIIPLCAYYLTSAAGERIYTGFLRELVVPK